jgi:hypothetical protein
LLLSWVYGGLVGLINSCCLSSKVCLACDSPLNLYKIIQNILEVKGKFMAVKTASEQITRRMERRVTFHTKARSRNSF